MIIGKITKLEYNKYSVDLWYNIFEKLLFGRKDKTIVVKQSHSYEYTFGGGNVYLRKNGKPLGNGNKIGRAIDQFKMSW